MDTSQVFSNQPRKVVDVVLITMPFGPLTRPSLGLSLLQARLQQTAISSKTLYFTLLFAKYIGKDTYEKIADGPCVSNGQAGEWIFSSVLFPEQDPHLYLEAVILRDDPYHQYDTVTRRMEQEKLSQHLLVVREQARHFVDTCLSIVLNHRPKIVGFTSTFQQQIASLALAKRIKEHAPQTVILFGGANVEGIMGIELLRQFPFVDAVVSGEGDIVFPEAATRLLDGRSLHGIPGVYTPFTLDAIGSGGIPNAPSIRDLDTLPYPNYDDFFTQKAELGLDFPAQILYETARGCWWGEKHHCTFCGLNGATMAFRSKSPDRAIQELVYLTERYPKCRVAAVDNILDMRYFKTFLPALAELDLDVELFYEVKANLKKEQLRLLKHANVQRIQPGIESFSSQVLHLMRKGVRALQNIQLLKWCRELEIAPAWNLIWGFPDEPSGEYAYIAHLLPLLTHLPPPGGYGSIRLDRFSPLFERAEHLGFTNVRPFPSYGYIYPGIPDHGLAKLAYHFTFDYEDGRDVPSYTRDVVQAIKTWQADQRSFYLIDDGTEVILWDLRPIATTLLTRLAGLERDLYLACDAIQSVDTLRRMAAPYVGDLSQDEMRTLMQRFVDMKLMVAEDESYLSLAVWLTKNSPYMDQYQEALAIFVQFQRLPEYFRLAPTSDSLPAVAYTVADKLDERKVLYE